MRSHVQLSILAVNTLLAATASGQENDPYAQPDDSWISLSGTVVDPDAESFTLDYGDGLIEVEVDDWDTYGEAQGLLDGEKVTVYGEIDEGLFESATIEAGSVYIESLNTYFYASNSDEEGDAYSPHFWTAEDPLTTGRATVRGTVSSVDEIDHDFTIDTGTQSVRVETAFLGYNPVDDLGYQKIEAGDRVSVSGDFDRDLLEGHELEADRVITLADADMGDGRG